MLNEFDKNQLTTTMLTLPELAKAIKRHPQTVRRWAHSKLIPSTPRPTQQGSKKPTRGFLFDPDAVRSQMEKSGLKEGNENQNH